MNEASNLELRRDLDELLSRARGRESVSYLISSLRELGWKGLGSNADFESTVERLGFRLDREYKKGGHFVVRTYVVARADLFCLLAKAAS